MEYEGYLATIEFDSSTDAFVGRVINTRDVITFEATSVRGLRKEFQASVDDYVSVQLPSGDTEEVRLRPEGNQREWSMADTMASGIYTAEYPPPTTQAERFAVNLDTVESDLAKLSPEQLREEVWPGVPFAYQTRLEDLVVAPTAGIGRGTLSKELLYGVLALLLLETYLAWRFGHHAT